MPGRVLVATDGSATAAEAVRWAAALASQNDAELMLVRVLTPAEAPDAGTAGTVATDLAQLAAQHAGSRGKARVLVDDDPARAIVRIAVEEKADLVVVGSAGMAGRKEFLLGNVPNRVSHLSSCSVVIVKTGQESTTTTGDANSVSGDRPQDKPYLLARTMELVRIVTKHRLGEALHGGLGHATARRMFAQRLRVALDEMGPTFAKIGQALSTRPDLLPPEIIEELATLQDHVSPLTQEQVVGVMENELSVPWEDVFESIDPQPLAAGTIAQVHRATLTGGIRVVVKVQRPNARADIERDLELLRAFAHRAEKRAGIKQFIDVAGVVDQLSTSLVRELDFRREAESITRMHDVLQSYPRLGVPRLYTELSTSRVLVMEEIAGLPIDAVPAGTARTEAARQLLESYFHQVIGVGFFHADPHPGNLVWRDDRLYFLDFGMVGEIDDDTRELLMLLLFALWRNDPGLLADVALTLSGSGARVGPGFEKELSELLTRYHDAPLADISLGVVLQEMTQTALRHGVRLPASLILASKALAQMQLAAAGLDPKLDPVAVAGSFISRLLLQRLRKGMDPSKLVSEFLRFRMRASRLSEVLEQFTEGRDGSGPEIRLRGAEELEKTIRQAGRRVALGLGLAGALVAATVSVNIRESGAGRKGIPVRRSPSRRLRGR
ncbi:AarF/UbiB family protein [Cryobacterium sp. Sr8]|uniref:AarF/UbiB family protein n=1 Tax=Cryobacterium sp. Sr8 TaxID=1259203 RepID=UPI00141AA1C1|nr:AarF/UbiB family protein [Cryobacterium sp. Sr8]